MRDARRAHAELCLEMAYQVSNPTISESLRAEAARYHAKAAKIEAGAEATKDGADES